MSRQTPMPSQVADAMITALAAISTTNGYLTTPLVVARGFRIDAVNLPKPSIFLLCSQVNADVRLHKVSATAMALRGGARWVAYFMVDQPVTAKECEAEVHKLTADFRQALQSDFQLSGLLATGFLDVGAITYDEKLSNDSYTVASAEVTAEWQWDTSTGP